MSGRFFYLPLFAIFLFSNVINAQIIKAVANDDWSKTSTWDLGRIPISTDTVQIEGYDVRLDVTASVAAIEVKNKTAGGNTRLQVQGNGIVLSVAGDLDINSIDENFEVVFQIETTDSVYVGGDLNITRNNTNNTRVQLNTMGTTRLMIAGDFNFNYYNSGSGEGDYDIFLQDDSQLEVLGKTTLSTHDGIDLDFIMEDNSQAILQDSLKLLLLGGLETAITVNHSAHFQLRSHAYLLNSGGSGTNHCKLKTGNAGGKMTITGNVTMESTASNEDIKLESNSATAEFNVLGDIIMNAFDEQDVIIDIKSGATFKLGGNVSRLTSYGYLYMDSDAIFVFNGTNSQSIPETDLPGSGLDAFDYTNIYLENNSGYPVTLTDDVVVNKNLTLTTGNIQTSSSALLILEDDAVITGASNLAYVIGPMTKKGRTNGSDFIFPLGDNGIYAPVEIEQITDATLEYTAQYLGCPPPTVSNLKSPLESINSQGYWTIERKDGLAVGHLTLHWNNADITGITDTTSLVVSYYDTGQNSWVSIGRSNSAGDLGTDGSGSIKNDIGCPPPTVAGLFAFGSTDKNANVLPVELINFRAYKNNDNSKVFLEWETASEINSDHFIVERSNDGFSFEQIATVEAANNSTSTQYYSAIDLEPSRGNNYYRIQQVDQDMIMSFSNLVTVFVKEQQDKMIIYPNPVKDYANLYSKYLTGQSVNIKIFDSSGNCVYSNPHETEPGKLKLYASDLNLRKTGIYFINIEDKKQTYSLEFLKLASQ